MKKNKKPNNMPEKIGIYAIDYIFDKYNNKYDKLVIDFIGGEPFICIDLLEILIPYAINKFESSNKTKWNTFHMSFSTNGTCFDNEKLKQLVEKYGKYMSIGLSLDGVKEIHDYNRSNSFDKVM